MRAWLHVGTIGRDKNGGPAAFEVSEDTLALTLFLVAVDGVAADLSHCSEKVWSRTRFDSLPS